MATTPVHLMILAVVQDQDLDTARRALEELGAPVVYMASSGGFLGRRNATLLIGLPVGSEGKVLESLRTTCRQRVEYMTMPVEGAPMPMPAPIQVTVGGATVFALPVERYEHF
ncbi:MAG TPA: cyclic-di-AMP receptor [Anaerolineales bacterium]|jgi:uncharacterized protein YaaQ|nr:cyclic-di-AMP receptor [Anaerolineales bacterium]